jgi:hypothetical protein
MAGAAMSADRYAASEHPASIFPGPLGCVSHGLRNYARFTHRGYIVSSCKINPFNLSELPAIDIEFWRPQIFSVRHLRTRRPALRAARHAFRPRTAPSRCASGRPRHFWLARAFSPDVSSSTSHHMPAKICNPIKKISMFFYAQQPPHSRTEGSSGTPEARKSSAVS